MTDTDIEPERWKIFDLEREPEKNFWNEIKTKSELKHRDNSHLPNTLEEIRESDKYEVERVWPEEAIQEREESVRREILDKMSEIASDNWGGKQEATKYDWKNAWQTLCDELENSESKHTDSAEDLRDDLQQENQEGLGGD